jgi:hypothetical protein
MSATDQLRSTDATFREAPRPEREQRQIEVAGLRRLHHCADLGLLTELALKHERQRLETASG